MSQDIAFQTTVLQALSVIQAQMGAMQLDIRELKEDVAKLKVDVSELKVNVAGLQKDVTYLKIAQQATDRKVDHIVETLAPYMVQVNDHQRRIIKLELVGGVTQ